MENIHKIEAISNKYGFTTLKRPSTKILLGVTIKHFQILVCKKLKNGMRES
jgi:hypothetical protein